MHGVDGSIEIQVPPVIDPDSAARFAADFARAAGDITSRVIVLAGRDGVFCRGMHPASADSSELRHHLHHFAESLLQMRYAGKPVIAVVDGAAFGGGLGLAATADMVIASDRSMFGLPEALFGFVPAVILPLLLERMRPKDCRLWMLSAYARSADEALTAGLVDVACPHEKLSREATRAARQFARVDANAVRLVKRMTSRPDLERVVREGVNATTEMLGNPDVSAAFLRFFEDGTMPWESR
jgi:enoyl-CoA hydratase/carnithine racemase